MDPAALEQIAETLQRLAVPSEHETAGRVLVEPVGQRRRARQPEAQLTETILQIVAALRPAMHRQPGGLVDDEH